MGAVLKAVNRVLVGVAGLVLAGGGASVLVASLDLRRRWGLSLPSFWPFDGPRDVLLSRAAQVRWRGEGWWWPAVIAALAVVVLLALWWLLAQVRRRRLRELVVDSGDGEEAVLRGRALEEAVCAEAEALEGVERALVALLGRRTAPEARVGLTLAPHASPAVALERLDGEALEHARVSAGVGRLPVEVRLRAVRHRAERVG
ncbi:alkaline shock response membrane anchor protein AmaP [Streptomyces aureoversilis]|uniref:Alkaline shock response membrane anchor protein AmaP n=1 Tax=Streptomyces aureoversilis TaxID=67277 RepID=A0ABW0A222_9ACTN